MSSHNNGTSSTGASNGAHGAFTTEARTLTGWGRTAPSTAEVLHTSDVTEIAAAVRAVATCGAPIESGQPSGPGRR